MPPAEVMGNLDLLSSFWKLLLHYNVYKVTSHMDPKLGRSLGRISKKMSTVV